MTGREEKRIILFDFLSKNLLAETTSLTGYKPVNQGHKGTQNHVKEGKSEFYKVQGRH